MAKFVIVGAGPIGMYTALKLIRLNVVPENITIIDKRLGEYTRPGHLVPENFTEVGLTLKMFKSSDTLHIKDLERGLFRKLEATNVQMIKARFEGFQEKSKETPAQVKTSVGNFPADFVFDCTGVSAEVAAFVNQRCVERNEAKYFISHPMFPEQSIKKHIFAHVKLSSAEASFLFHIGSNVSVLPPNISVDKAFQFLIELHKLGWKYPALPTFYTSKHTEKRKYCLYMEAPDNLSQENYRPWINLLLRFYSKGKVGSYEELNPSTKYKYKPRIMSFECYPHFLEKSVYNCTDLPMIFICGDALRGGDYRISLGITCGVELIDITLEHLSRNKYNAKEIKIEELNQKVGSRLKEYIPELVTILKYRQTVVKKGYSFFGKVAFASSYKTEGAELAYKLLLDLREKNCPKTSIDRMIHLNKCLRYTFMAANTSDSNVKNEIELLQNQLLLDLKTAALNLNVDYICRNHTDVYKKRLIGILGDTLEIITNIGSDASYKLYWLVAPIRIRLENVSPHVPAIF